MILLIMLIRCVLLYTRAGAIYMSIVNIAVSGVSDIDIYIHKAKSITSVNNLVASTC